MGPGTCPRLAPACARVLAATALAGVVVFADLAEIAVTPIARENEVVVSFDLSDGFTPEVREAIRSGLPTTFSYDVELRTPSSWLDHTVAAVAITATVRFDNLTRRYQMSRSLDGRVEDARPTEDQEAVRRWMTHFERVPLSSTRALEPGAEYYVRVRARTRPHNTWFVWPWDPSSALGRAKFTFIQ